MADIKQIQVDNNIYNFKDEEARQVLANTYTKEQINNLIVPANTEIVVVEELPQEDGAANTIYRVQGEDSYTDYGWDGTQYIALATYNGTNLYSSTGQNTDGAMTQKSVTENLTVTLMDYTKEDIAALEKGKGQWWISASLKWRTTTSNYFSKRIYITPYRGRTITITPQSETTCQVAFLTAWGESAGNPGPLVSTFCDNESVRSINSATDIVIPYDAVYLYVCHEWNNVNILPETIKIKSLIVDSTEELMRSVEDLASDIAEFKDKNIVPKVEQLDSENKIEDVALYKNTSQILNTHAEWPIRDTDVWGSTNYGRSWKLSVLASYIGKTFVAVPQNGKNVEIAFLKSWPTTSSGTPDWCDGYEGKIITAETYETIIPIDAVYIYVGRNDGSHGTYCVPESVTIKETKTLKEVVKESIYSLPVVYVDQQNGSDDNNGTQGSPVASIEAALNYGAETMTIVLSGGGYYNPIDFVNWEGKKQHVTLRGWKDVRRIIHAGKILSNLSNYTGYENVYTWVPGTGETLPSGDYLWLWQHNIPDTSTAIPSDEIHPLQRRRGYRRLSTCIKHSSSLENLLAATEPCWVVDNDTLYIRAVAGSDVETNPIVVPSSSPAIKCPASFDVTLVNIEAWYGCILVDSAYGFEAVDCAARYTRGEGAWRIDDGIAAKLIRCEADSNTMPSTTKGDGFNLHPTTPSIAYAKGGTHTLIDCWSHDNRDDGYSDHGRSDGTIIGGLYEYNNQGGLTPSTGSHDTIIGAVCRKNTSRGILYTGDVGGGDVQCIGCVSYGNNRNFECKCAQSADSQNVMILERCTSRDATEAGYVVGTNSTVYLSDCTDYGSAVAKKAEGSNKTFVVKNGTLVL